MIYVDTMRARFGRMVMCHLVADSETELHAMADRIGVARRWFQDKAGRLPHYDICLSKRALALRHGAQVIDRRRLAELIRLWRVAAVTRTGRIGV